MNNYFETMNNCRDYIRNNPNVKEGYENLDGSSCSGFEYIRLFEMKQVAWLHIGLSSPPQ